MNAAQGKPTADPHRGRVAASGEGDPKAEMSTLRELLFHDWGTKGLALILALVVFVITRDEITRSYSVPLEVRSDPARVLETKLPDEVQVRVRGPWAKMAEVREGELGPIRLDLAVADPGPLRLDPGRLALPEGVWIDGLDYARVDLRFEAVEEREFAVVPRLAGQVHLDYEVAASRVEPRRVRVRGPVSALDDLTELETERVSTSGATETLTQRVRVHRPDPRVSFPSALDGEATVSVTVEVRPRTGERPLEVSVADALEESLREVEPRLAWVDPPRVVVLDMRGPIPALEAVERSGGALRPEIELQFPAGARAAAMRGGKAPITAHIRFRWSPAVASDHQASIALNPETVQLELEIVRARSP